MINPVLQVEIISISQIGIVFAFAFVIVGLSVYGLLASNKERWLNIRKTPFKKFIIDVPGNVIVKIITNPLDTIELKILGKKRTYFCPDSASKDGKVYHYDFDNSNPKITPERRKWRAPSQKDIEEKKMPVFRDYYNSEEISKLISNRSFGMYQRAKVALEINNILMILIIIGIAVSGFGVYTMNQFIDEFPQVLERTLRPIVNGGG